MLCPDCQQSFEDLIDPTAAHLGTASRLPPTQIRPQEVLGGGSNLGHPNSSAEATPKRHTPAKVPEQEASEGAAPLCRLPLILVECGHTLCHTCLCNRFQQVVINGGGSWQQASRLTCNKCPECTSCIINEQVFQKLGGVRRQDQARIAGLVQSCFPINRALLNLKRTFTGSKETGLRPSPGIRKKRMLWPDQEQHDDGDAQQISMILEDEGDRYLEAGPGKYSEGRAYAEEAEDVDEDYQQMQQDFHHIQAQVHQEIQLYEDRQKKMTYLTQQSQDEADEFENGSSEYEEDDEDTDQEDVAEEGETDFGGQSPVTNSKHRGHPPRRMESKEEHAAQHRSMDEPAQSKRKKQENLKCRIHSKKKIQAFCADCKKVMCINCILDQAHKGHEMMDINVAAQAQRRAFEDGLRIAKANQSELENQILTIRNHISEIEINAQKQREKIGQIFNEIRQKIMVREQLLKKRLSEMLETEETLYKQRIENLKDQIRCIKDLELEQSKLSNESDLTVLQRCELRGEILADAKKEVRTQRLINCIPQIKKEEELACIVSIILPKKYRAQLLSSKLHNHFRKIQGLDSAKRHEFGRYKKDPRGGNNLDGSAGSVSHSSLCSGNLLCFPSSRLPHSQSNMRNRHNKDRHARVHKIVLHQRLNSQQHGVQLKKLDNNFVQKSRNDQPHTQGPAEQITLQNMSPNYTPQSRLQNQGQVKVHQGHDRASPVPNSGRIDSKHQSGKLNNFQFPQSQFAYHGASAAANLLPLMAAQQPSPALAVALPSQPQPPPPAGDTTADPAARNSSASAAAQSHPPETFWSLRSQRTAQNQVGTAQGQWQWRATGGVGGGGQSCHGVGQPGRQHQQQLKTKRANAQMVGLSVVRRLQQKDWQDTARREHHQHQQTSLHHHLHNGSGFGIASQKLNLTVEQHNLAAVAPTHRGDDKNDEIESMKTQKRGASPEGHHHHNQQATTSGGAGPGQTTMDNFAGGAFGVSNLSLLQGQHFGAERGVHDDLQKFTHNDKTIERIDIVKQQLSIDLAEQSLLQQIDESEEARDQQVHSLDGSQGDKKRGQGKQETAAQHAPNARADAEIIPKLTQRGAKKGTRNSENKLEPEQKQSKSKINTKVTQSRHISRQQHAQAMGTGGQISESGKTKPKVRKFNQLHYCVAPAITERGGKVEPMDGSLLKNEKKGNHELTKMLTEAAGKESARQSRKKKERSGLQSPASQPSPSAPRAPVNIEKLTKTRLLYQDRGYSQGRSTKKNWLKRDKEGNSSKRHNFRACPSSQIDLKPSNEKLLSSVTRSNLDRTSDEQARSLSKTRKQWKDRSSIEQQPRERESVSPETDGKLPTAITRDGNREGVKHAIVLPSSCSASARPQHETDNDKPTLIQETYYKKQRDHGQQEQNQEENERSDYDTVAPRATQGQANDFEIRSQQSSASGGAKDRSRGSLNTVQRKQWTKKNSLSKRISDGMLHRPVPTALKQTMQESPVSLKTCVQDQTNEVQSSSNHPDIRISVPDVSNQPAQVAATSKTSLYQMILHHNHCPKQGQAGQGGGYGDGQQRRKALQHSQSGPNGAIRPAKKSKSSLNKGVKTIGDATTLDAQNSGVLNGTMSFQRGTGATSKTAYHMVDKSGKNSATNIYQQTATINQSAFQNTQLTTSFQQQPMSAHSQGALQNKVLLPYKAKSRTATRSNQQTSGSLATRQSQRKKKKNPKSKKETKDLLKESANEHLQSTQDNRRHTTQGGDGEPEAAALLPSSKTKRHHSRKKNRNGAATATTSSGKKQRSNRKQLEELKDRIREEGKIEHYQTLVLPEAGSDDDYANEKVLATVRELFEQTDHKAIEAPEMAGSQMELASLSCHQQKYTAQIQQSSEEDSCDQDEEESVGEGETEVRSAGRPATSPNRRDLDNPQRRLRSGELAQSKHRADKLYSAATKCKSPEPMQQIEILRRFELTSPKKMLRGLEPRRERQKTVACKTIPQKQMESQKLCMVDADEGERDALEGCEEVEDAGGKYGARTSLQQTLPLKNNLVILVDPSPSVRSKLVEGGFEQKVRSKSSQVQELFSRGYSTQQKRPSRESMMQTRDQVELPAAARPVSRYSSCDFQVDDDERTDTPHYQNKPKAGTQQQCREAQADGCRDDQIANEPNPSDHRSKMKTIHQSSYSIAQMQPMRYQKKKVTYEEDQGTNAEANATDQQQPPQQESSIQIEQILAPVEERRDQEEKAQGPSGQQQIKKSIQKKLIRELGVDRERNEQGRGDQGGNTLLTQGPHSNRSIGKPFLRIAEPTRAHSPLSAYSNISSSHSSKYQSVKIAPKDFGASLHASKPSMALGQILSPSTRSKVKKLTVKSFIHCSSLSQLNPNSTPGAPHPSKAQPPQAPSILPQHNRHPSQGSLLEIIHQVNQPSGPVNTSPSHGQEFKTHSIGPLGAWQMASPVASSRPDRGFNPNTTISNKGENMAQRADRGKSTSGQQKENDSQCFNPVEAAIAEVKMQKTRKTAGQSDRQHSDQKANSSRQASTILDHGSNHKKLEKGGRNHAGSSGKKRSRKIRKLFSIPSIQARSRTSLPAEPIMQGQIFDKPLTPIKMSQFANLNNYMKAPPEAAGLSTVGADFAASIVSGQSKSELYRVKEEFFFIFGGIGASKGPADSLVNSSQSIEVMDVSREICREFKFNNDSMLVTDDENLHQRPQEPSTAKIIGKEGKDCFPIHGFRAIQFQLDKQYAKKNQISKFEDRIFLLGGQNETGKVLDQVHEYSVNDMHTLFTADWKLPHDLSDFSIAQGNIRRNDLSQSVFIAGGLKQISQKERMMAPIKSVYRLFLDKSEASSECLVLGTDMTTGLDFKCEILPEMNQPRSHFSLVFNSLNNQQDYELYAIGGVDESTSTNAEYAIEKYSSRTKEWTVLQLKNDDDFQTASTDLSAFIVNLQGHQSILLPDGSIYIIGGYSTNVGALNGFDKEIAAARPAYTNQMLRFDTGANTISSSDLPSMNQPRGFFTAILAQNLRYIYVIGGFTNKKSRQNQNQNNSAGDLQFWQASPAVDSVEKFDTFSKKWQLVAPMKSKKGMHALCQMIM